MPSTDPFWNGMARLRATKDVDIAWREHFGTAYDQAKAYLTAISDPAYRYPCSEPCGMSCRMRVREGTEGFFAFCPEDPPQADAVPLADEDVIMHEIDMRAVCRDTAKALSLQAHSAPEPVMPYAWHIGTVAMPPGRNLPVYMAFPWGKPNYTDIASRLLARGRTANILLVPDTYDDETRKLIEDNEGRIFSLSAIAGGVPGKVSRLLSLSSVITTTVTPVEPMYRFERNGEYWHIRWNGGETKPIKDSLGLRYYRILIDKPYVTFSAHDLRKLADRVPDAPKPGMSIEVADEEALRAYQREMEDLQFQLEEAIRNQSGGASDLRTRIEELNGHIRKTYNLHECIREESDELERARKSVSAAMDVARKKLSDEGLTDLAVYLDKFMPTGTFLKYHPTHRIDWNT